MRLVTVWGLSEVELRARLRRARMPVHGSHVAIVDHKGSTATLRIATGGGEQGSGEHQGADERLAEAVDAVANVLGDSLVSSDGRAAEEVVVALAGEQDLTVGAVESLTCGLLAARLSEPPGGGSVFAGSIVSYSSEVKHRLLQVPPGPVVSREAAVAMATGGADLLGADLVVSTTGVAGPEPQDGQPVGRVYVATHLDGCTEVLDASTTGTRPQIRDRAVATALNAMRCRLLERDRANRTAPGTTPGRS